MSLANRITEGFRPPLDAEIAQALKDETGYTASAISDALNYNKWHIGQVIRKGVNPPRLQRLVDLAWSGDREAYKKALISAVKSIVSGKTSIESSEAKKIDSERSEAVEPDAVEIQIDPVAEARAKLIEAKARRIDRESLKQAAVIEEEHDLFRSLCGAYDRNGPPDWVALEKIGVEPSIQPVESTAIAVLSDTHFDEVVSPAEVDYINEYSREIAGRRLALFFNNAVALARSHVAGVQYDGFVLCMGGDMISGDIHEELAQSNEATSIQTVLHWSGLIAAGIRQLADEFGRVYVPCVVGNHGRTTRKPRAKGRVHTSLDWMMYQIIARDLQGDDRVTIDISESADLHFNVHGTRFLLTHGDQFRGGSGIAGALSPLMLGDSRKRKRNSAAGRPYDYMIVGHWHQYGMFKSIIMNGSLKGYDEYAYVNNFEVEPPQQAFFIVDPRHGITLRAPIHCSYGERYSI